MKKSVVFIIILLIGAMASAQELGRRVPKKEKNEEEGSFRGDNPLNNSSSLRGVKDKKDKPPVTDYKIISFKNDTTYVDTTLTIQKDYRFNYLRRDDFEIAPVNNVGQTHISLAKVEEPNHLLPLFGARARHFNFLEAEDINYYSVPTPLTELYFKTTFEQGQQLDAFITINTSPRLNLSIAYKGIRSLGKYQHALTSSGNFRATASYFTKNNRYHLKTHFVSQDLLNEENGGLSEQGVNEYLGRNIPAGTEDEFADRGSITVNFENAESILLGKRFYLDHSYELIQKTDSTTTGLSIGHIMDLTDKSFQYDQTTVAPNNLFGEAYSSGVIQDKAALEDFTNQLYLDFSNKWLGSLRVKGGSSNYNYGYNSVITLGQAGSQTNITNRLEGDIYFVGGEYKNNYKGFQLFADGMTILSGDFDGNYVNAGAGYDLNDKYGASIKISTSSVAPNYNFLLYQSDYINYNWQNYNNSVETDNFSNIETQKIQLTLKAKKIANIEASYSTIDNYTYFTKNTDSITLPEQFDGSVNLLKVKLTQGLTFGKFGLDNTIMYQNVSEGENVYRVPEIVTRNSLYYQDHWFKKALFLQTGVTFKYYSEYDADGYDPVLSEFYVQSPEEIAYFDQESTKQTFGGFPQFDIFFNAKIKQTRIFFKVENFGEAFMQNNEFAAPGYAPRDAVIRFGLVWNFFL
ncbi:putative porin [Aquimarina sp. 2201CG5-10]|uniref:putative porin n=1 Tax=Aquimarina callyspongiae TaxID=3098150 RepID=UPI002AB538A1|nr:putative porin [Aquimarina sp. 2201CG5-10]MDY8136409.1 putative porin [Aquimarina sp. 2201CG5-10]